MSTVIGRKTFPKKLETPAEAEKMAVETEQESKTKNKKQKGKGKVDRRIAKTSGSFTSEIPSVTILVCILKDRSRIIYLVWLIWFGSQCPFSLGFFQCRLLC